MTTFKQLMEGLEAKYPPKFAEDWDRIGLHFGDPEAAVKKVMTCLDIRSSVVDEAIERQVDTIVVHHPILFHPIKRFDLSNPQNQLFARLIKHDIKVFAMHTNNDSGHDGMNDWLAQALGLTNIRSLEIKEDSPGIGRIGDLPQALTREELINLLKRTFSRTQLAIIERQPKKEYRTIGLVGGSGNQYASMAAQQGADVFLTGDISYHSAQGHEDLEMMTVDIGHYAENIFAKEASRVIEELVEKNQWQIESVASTTNINPFRYE